MKYLVVVNSDLDNHLKENGFEPINTKSNRSIYIKSEDLSLCVNGWHWETNFHGRVKAHFDLN